MLVEFLAIYPHLVAYFEMAGRRVYFSCVCVLIDPVINSL